MVTLQEMSERIKKKIDKKNLLINQRDLLIKEHEKLSETLENTLKARVLIQTVAKDTQQNIEFHISKMVTMALTSVFPDPYEFQLRFTERRNITEADLIFLKNGNETNDILNTGGGGVVDIASFALRIALWSLKKTRPIFLLDEPMKFVSRNLQSKTSLLMKELSEKLDIQFIVVSHIPELSDQADKIIEV